MEKVTLQLPDALLRDASRVAAAQDVTIGHLVRVLLRKEVERRLNPKTPMRADETLLAALQALLARDMAEAENWEDLDARLSCHGYMLRPAGGGLTLYKISDGMRVCKASELGFSYPSLVKRFQAALPGHPFGTLGLVARHPYADVKPLTQAEQQRLVERLTPHFNAAESWQQLAEALGQRGFDLRPTQTGIALFKTGQGRHICDTSALGYSLAALIQQFGELWPDGPSSDKPQSDRQDALIAQAPPAVPHAVARD
ncbi:MAG: hypothetical protein AAF943_00605 [Pseudomonadota bacterium]